MQFLKESKEMAKYNLCPINSTFKKPCFVTGTVSSSLQSDRRCGQDNRSKGMLLPCLVCNTGETQDTSGSIHNVGSCSVWGNLTYEQRSALVRCIRHPFSRDGHTTNNCARGISKICSHCQKENTHNSLLCPQFKMHRNSKGKDTSRATSDM